MQRRFTRYALFPASTLAAVLAMVPPVAPAEDAHAHREHGPHEHGVGSLNLVVDGSMVEIELESPAANIVGFEHAPKDAAERATLERAVATLKDGARLFGFPAAAGCRLSESSVTSSLLVPEPPAEDQDEHQAQDHSQTRESDQDAGHQHEHETHADLDADYRFDCRDPAQIDRVDVRLFSLFPGTQRLRVQHATAQGQGATELSAGSPRIDLR